MPSDGERALGLRERKKARTRAAIQRHALRLFKEQGYDATTVSQIADAVEISESTFFRYFPTKEAVVLWDELDPAFEAAFRAQPPDIGPVAALRAAMRAVFDRLPESELVEQRERWTLAMAIPQLRAAMVDQFTGAIDQICGMVAERTSRRPDDFPVVALAGAIVGVVMAVVITAADDPSADFIDLADRAFAQLEAGLPI
ncbi:MAG TPA: TetR family transcriptional regulator [Candidatus Dormibacteraeota bacterium]|nr:TetR family transcriptional regulator [Candidatus Dormibacteraeota bacterium]